MRTHQPAIEQASGKIKLIRGGREYFTLLESLIHQARESIHLQTYIYQDDETGLFIASALKTAATRNVKVYLLVDGYASQWLPAKFIDELKEAGVHFRFFEPFFRSKYFYFGRRMHHKIFVIDGKHAVVGGINIADRYNDMPGCPAWLDFAVLAEGDIARDLCILCSKTWNSFSDNIHDVPYRVPSSLITPSLTGTVKMRRNDWVRKKNEISATYIDMFRNAKSHITIVCSYFLPGKVIRRLLRNASSRGVKIRVITAGISDIMLAKHAERWLYDWLLRNQIELYEYQPSVLHAKVALCDSEWLTIGSYNLNDISTYASIELNLDITDPFFAKTVEDELEKILQSTCIEITTATQMKTRNIFIQFKRWCAYHIIRFIYSLFTFYYRQRP